MKLNENAYPKDKKINPHELDLYKLQSVETKEQCTAYEFVNHYIHASNCYIEKHPQAWNNLEVSIASYKTPDRALGFYSEINSETIQKIMEEVLELTSPEKDVVAARTKMI